MLQHIQEIEEQHKLTVQKLQHHVQEKEKVLAAEFAEAEQVYKTTEHDLREQLEEKTQIIEVNLELLSVFSNNEQQCGAFSKH